MWMLVPVDVSARASDRLSVDLVDGSLAQAIQILVLRHGVPIDVESTLWDPTQDLVYPSSGRDPYFDRRVRALAFTYDGGVDEALGALLAAWRAAGGSGDYVVESVARGTRRRVVPTTRTERDGTHVRYDTPLACVVHLSVTSGRPQQLYEHVLHSVGDQCSVPILDLGGAVRRPAAPSGAPIDVQRIQRSSGARRPRPTCHRRT